MGGGHRSLGPPSWPRCVVGERSASRGSTPPDVVDPRVRGRDGRPSRLRGRGGIWPSRPELIRGRGLAPLGKESGTWPRSCMPPSANLGVRVGGGLTSLASCNRREITKIADGLGDHEQLIIAKLARVKSAMDNNLESRLDARTGNQRLCKTKRCTCGALRIE